MLKFTNHAEAKTFASAQHDDSNLARCYLSKCKDIEELTSMLLARRKEADEATRTKQNLLAVNHRLSVELEEVKARALIYAKQIDSKRDVIKRDGVLIARLRAEVDMLRVAHSKARGAQKLPAPEWDASKWTPIQPGNVKFMSLDEASTHYDQATISPQRVLRNGSAAAQSSQAPDTVVFRPTTGPIGFQTMTRRQHLLTILAEECVEVAQRVSKALRFGLYEVQADQPYNNAQRLGYEFCDLLAAVEMLEDDGVTICGPDTDKRIFEKKAKVEEGLKHSQQCGTVRGSL